jgi:hypothetical protein
MENKPVDGLSQKKSLDKVNVPVYTIRFKCSFFFFAERA